MLKLKGNLIDISSPVVMGILNVTPDSFHAKSRVSSNKDLLMRTEKMLEDGATILDIGGYSTRPHADDTTSEEEIRRVIPAITLINKEFPDAYISIDTFRSKVAHEATEAGACIINDISGGTLDKLMFETVARTRSAYIMTHMRGTPQTMTAHTVYEDLLTDMMDFYVPKVRLLRDMGVTDIVIDPGFGFAKTVSQNYEILKSIQYFQQLNLPLLVGVSRKSMIYKVLGISAGESLNGTTVLNTIALTKGADILRVHDVKEAVESIRLYKTTFG